MDRGSSLFSMISGIRYEFQLLTKTMVPTVARIGRDSGRVT